MTSHYVPRGIQGTIQPRRLGNNGQVPQTALFQRAAHGINLSSVHQQKCYMAACEDLTSLPDPSSSTNGYYMCYGYVPAQTTNIRAFIGTMGSTYNQATEANPRARITWGKSGATSNDTDPLRYTVYSVSGTAATPDQVHHGFIDFAVTGGADHSFVLRTARLRPIYCTIIGYSRDGLVDDTVAAGVDPTRFGTLSPIQDADLNALSYESARALCYNGCQLISWTRLFDATTAMATTTSASYTQMTLSDDYYIPNLAYLETREQPGIRVKLAVNAYTTSGSTNGVEIIDADTNTQQLEVTGISATSSDETFSGWSTATGTITSGVTKLAIRIKSDGAATFRVNAVSLFMYFDPV